MSSQVISRSVLFQPGPARSASYTSLSNLINRRREFCHLAGTPSPSLLRHLLKGEGVQQNRKSRRRLRPTARPSRCRRRGGRSANLAGGESSVTLLHPTLASVGVSTVIERGCQQNEASANHSAGSSRSSAESRRPSRRRDFCHCADTPSSSLLKNLLEGVEGCIRMAGSPTARVAASLKNLE